MPFKSIIFVGLLFGWAVAHATAGQMVVSKVNVNSHDLVAPLPSENWVSYNGDYSGRRYSQLSEINVNNVGRLRAEWIFHAHNSDRMEVTPVQAAEKVVELCATVEERRFQRCVSSLKSMSALAPVLWKWTLNEFFRSLCSREWNDVCHFCK